MAEFPYEAIEPESLPVLILWGTLSVASWFFTIGVLNRWIKRKNKPALLLMITFSCFAIGMTSLFLGLLHATITGFKYEIYMYGLLIGYTAEMAANVPLLLFAVELFSLEMKHARKYVIACIVVTILVALPINFYGWPESLIPDYSIRLYSSAAMLATSVLIYSRIYSNARRAQKRVTDKYAKVAFKYIAWSQIAFIACFLLILLDTITFEFTDATGYTVFNYIAWVFAFIFFVLCYIAYMMPKSVRDRIDAKS